MKRTLLLICTLLCANVLFAQTFEMGNVTYDVKYNTTDEVNVVDCDNVSLIIIPETVTYNGVTYNVTAITGTLGRRNGDWCRVGAFEGCTNLTSVTLPNSVTLIDERAFYGCTSLTSINIPNNVTLIAERAFQSCSTLTSVIVGNSVISIEDSAFYACTNLTSLQLGENLERIENSAFQNCDSLISVDIPNSVTFVGDYAFYDCEALTSIVIGNNVTSVGKYAFAYSEALTSIIIGESVNNIGVAAFANSLFSLQNVTCLATTPPTLANNTVFPYPNIASLTVPCGTLEAYSSPTSYWNAFFNGRISEDCGGETGLEDLNAVEISFFPNPTNSKVTFNQAIERIELMDLAGKTLRTFRNESEINIEQLPAGVYYLRLTNNEKTTLRKLIKE